MRFLAAEKLSEHKYKTAEGYLVCVDAVLSRTGKQKYIRSELFGDSCKNPTDEVEVDRLESDVFNEKAMASFENKPICIEHPDEDVNVANHNDLSVGFVRDIKRGTDNGQPVMLGTLVITDENAIDLVESGEYAELSCGYDCDIADDEHPTQRNIRGNHVALCKRGRAGIARIVDSVKDEIPAGYIMIEYTYDGDSWSNYLGRVLVKASSEQEAIVKAKKHTMNTIPEKNPRYFRQSNDMYRNVDVIDMNDFAVMRFDFSTNIAAFERAIVNNDAAEFNAMLSTFEKDIADYNQWKAEGKLSAADVGKVKRQIDKINNLLAKSSINKRFEVKDMASLTDANYEQWTKQGWRVAALYKDGERIHAIVERKSGDFVVALGYNTSTGEWAQGRYVSTFAAAIDTLNEEKPAAIPIRDIKDAWTDVYKQFEAIVTKHFPNSAKINAEVDKLYAQHKGNADWDLAYKRWKETGAEDSVHASDSKKTFEVSFVKDGVTYIRKVKANCLQDAIRNAIDERLSPMTYKRLKELGVSQRQWSGWTQEQANEYIRKHSEANQSTAKQKKQSSASVEELFDKKSLEKATKIIRRMGTPYDSDVQNALDELKINAEAWEEDRDRVAVSSDSKDDIIKAATFFKSLGYKFRVSSYEEDDETSYEFVLK